ncbi:hypothetical protein PCH_Pc13g03720 [Penicillium rubens Wisconsin 54-1255]|uniref:Uncharacterized protein n=1 Tax=Penicillium rubens (strain ATCC 28089 / DSM 1075 / NRRL 1951 / Wisconsin 54-1255) TaxID=500485 RepID=B6H217_PENRW|nr:hypothetical protein PCH_Pc13g03720 [Penicillium rubens Wisconsin 54-1255]
MSLRAGRGYNASMVASKRCEESTGKTHLTKKVDKATCVQVGPRGFTRGLIGNMLANLLACPEADYDQPTDCPEGKACHGQARCDQPAVFPEAKRTDTVRLEVVDRSGFVDQRADCRVAEDGHDWKWLNGVPRLIEVAADRPKAEARRSQTRSGVLVAQPADCPEPKARHAQTGSAEARHGQTGSGGSWLIGVGIEVVDWGVLTHQPADCPKAEARHGQTGGWLIGPADCPEAEARHGQTGSGGSWSIESADCPEAKARHGQTGSGGSWSIEVVDWGVLTDQSADCPEAKARHGQTAEARHGQTGSGGSWLIVVVDWGLVDWGLVDWGVLTDQPTDCPEAEARHGQAGPPRSDWGLVDWGWLTDQPADCPEAEAEARHGQTGSGGSWLIGVGIELTHRPNAEARHVLIDQSADCPEAEARHGQTGLPIVLKPRPATVRLIVGDLTAWLGSLIAQPADCPEAEARHGQTGSGGSWLVEVGIEVVDLGVLTHQPADCPEAEARHGQTGSGGSWLVEVGIEVVDLGVLTHQPADCPEAEARHGQTGSGGSWLIGVGIEVVDWGVLTHQPADCPEAEARHGQTGSGGSWLIGVGIEVVDWGVLTDQSADCPEAEARHGQTGSGRSPPRSDWEWFIGGWLIEMDRVVDRRVHRGSAMIPKKQRRDSFPASATGLVRSSTHCEPKEPLGLITLEFSPATGLVRSSTHCEPKEPLGLITLEFSPGMKIERNSGSTRHSSLEGDRGGQCSWWMVLRHDQDGRSMVEGDHGGMTTMEGPWWMGSWWKVSMVDGMTKMEGPWWMGSWWKGSKVQGGWGQGPRSMLGRVMMEGPEVTVVEGGILKSGGGISEKKKRCGGEKERRRENLGKRGYLYFFQWLKDRKALGSATSSDKMGRNAGEPIETRRDTRNLPGRSFPTGPGCLLGYIHPWTCRGYAMEDIWILRTVHFENTNQIILARM